SSTENTAARRQKHPSFLVRSVFPQAGLGRRQRVTTSLEVVNGAPLPIEHLDGGRGIARPAAPSDPIQDIALVLRDHARDRLIQHRDCVLKGGASLETCLQYGSFQDVFVSKRSPCVRL